jgi:small neutral amino acid transporter SnatA (MarC family)
MKKNYFYIAAGLVLVYWYMKEQKAKQPVEKLAVNSEGSQSAVTVEPENFPLLISPSEQQQINEFSKETISRGDNKNVSVRYIAGTHYI